MKNWYIVQSHSSFENKVAQEIKEEATKANLADKIEEIIVPTHDITEVKRGKRVQRKKKYFPGYVLLKSEMDNTIYHMIKNLKKVSGFLGTKGTPIPVSEKEIEKIDKQLLRINDFMVGMFRGVGIKLVDFKVEFGRIKNNGKIDVMLADEISPDTCRLWDNKTEKKLDKDRFRKGLGNLIEAYQEVARRLDILHEQSNIRPLKYTKPQAVKIKKKQ